MIGQGQINETTDRWNIIQKIFKNNKIKNIVEIGTCTGAGSTLCILSSMENDSKFTSIESNHNFFEIAKKNLKNYKENFELIHGRIIEIDDVKNFISEFQLNHTQSQWLESDLQDFEKCENVISRIPENIDFLLLDGGEFSTYSEWKKLKNRTKIVALDDINVMKCNKIFLELINDYNYEMIFKTDEGNGFCVFKKK